MKNKFHGYYLPSDQEFESLWNDAVIALDANVLLNLYTYSASTAEEILNLFSDYSERLWLPHQCAAEFHANRCGTILKEAKRYSDVAKSLDQVALELSAKRRHPYLDSNLAERFDSLVEEVKSNLVEGKDRHKHLIGDDPICEKISAIFNERVGDQMDAESLKCLYSEGAKRFERRIPPGYEDAKKPVPERYGDLVLWKQIIAHASSQGTSAILVTDDLKDDWWQSAGSFRVGPRPELRQEFKSITGHDVYLYSTESFVERANKLGKLVSDQAVAEIEKAAEDRASLHAASPQIQTTVRMGRFDAYRVLQAAGVSESSLEEIREAFRSVKRDDEDMHTAVRIGNRVVSLTLCREGAIVMPAVL